MPCAEECTTLGLKVAAAARSLWLSSDVASMAESLEVDREFVDSDSTYSSTADSELTSLSSSVTAYVSLAGQPYIGSATGLTGGFHRSTRMADDIMRIRRENTTHPTMRKRWTGKT